MPERAEDGGYEVVPHHTCLSQFWEVRLVNGEGCFWGAPMANRPEMHLHLTRDEAHRCARERLAMGITMPGPEAARA